MNKSGGLILLNKPPGITSFSVLGAVKKELGTKKVGHTGTLDKFAEGLIIALSGKMTRLVPRFTGMDKVYEALMLFGEETDTLDPEGRIIANAPVPEISVIEEAVKQFHGKILQTPPAYSAVHIDGRRAYERVRNGENPEMPSREIEIYGFEILSWDKPFLKTRIHCSKGTYIRSLARDLALQCGSRARLEELKRTAVGPYGLDRAAAPENFTGDQHLISPWAIFEQLPGTGRLVVDDCLIGSIKMGKQSVLTEIVFPTVEAGDFALFSSNKEMLALMRKDSNGLTYSFVC